MCYVFCVILDSSDQHTKWRPPLGCLVRSRREIICYIKWLILFQTFNNWLHDALSGISRQTTHFLRRILMHFLNLFERQFCLNFNELTEVSCLIRLVQMMTMRKFGNSATHHLRHRRQQVHPCCQTVISGSCSTAIHGSFMTSAN